MGGRDTYSNVSAIITYHMVTVGFRKAYIIMLYHIWYLSRFIIIHTLVPRVDLSWYWLYDHVLTVGGHPLWGWYAAGCESGERAPTLATDLSCLQQATHSRRSIFKFVYDCTYLPGERLSSVTGQTGLLNKQMFFYP